MLGGPLPGRDVLHNMSLQCEVVKKANMLALHQRKTTPYLSETIFQGQGLGR